MAIINDEFQKNVGKRLSELREKMGLTRTAAAKQLGISYKTIERHEKGENLPKIDSLTYYAEGYNTTIDYILYGKETSDDNSFTWYDNYKRLNRLWYTMCIELNRDKENPSDVYLKLKDNQAKEWFGVIERFENHKENMFESGEGDTVTDIKDLDALFEEYKGNNAQIYTMRERDIDRKMRAAFLGTTPPLAEYRVEDNNDSRDYILRVNKTKSDDKQ